MDEKEYHRKRRMFCIVNDRVHLAPEKDERSHREWMDAEGLSDNFEEEVRGVVYEDRLIFFRGSDWQADEKAEKIFFLNIADVAKLMNLQKDTLICGGCIVGKIGEVWPPKKVFGRLGDFLK